MHVTLHACAAKNAVGQRTLPDRPAVHRLSTAVLSDTDQCLLSTVFFTANGTVLTIIGLQGVPYLVVLSDLDVTLYVRRPAVRETGETIA
jgi:hypothetical protein